MSEQAFAHWQALVAWWSARQVERKAIGRKWAPKIAPVATDPPGSTVEQPTGSGPAAGPVGTIDRRQALRARYHALPRRRREHFCSMSAAPDDLDAVEAALERAEGKHKTVAEAPPQTHKTAAPRPHPPDEGAGDIGLADVEALKKRFEQMSPAAKAWAGALPAQSNAGHCWRINEQATVRRYELYRGVFALAEWGLGEEAT